MKQHPLHHRTVGFALRFHEGSAIEPKPKRTPATPAIAVTEPLKKPTQPVLAIFGSKIRTPNGKLKERFIWEETKGIE